MLLRTSSFVVASLVSALSACSAGGNSAAAGASGTTGSGGSSSDPDGTGANPGLTITQAGDVDPNDTRDVPVRKMQCDENGQNCLCLRLALLGTLDSSATDTDTGPFVAWLNSKAGGTATATLVTTKPTLDAAFLDQYDVLIVSNVNGWTFSAEEKAAVAAWSAGGGGIISLTGFITQSTEPAATSQLIEFAGMSYTSEETAKEGDAQSTPVYYDGGTEDLKNCLAWSDPNDTVVEDTAAAIITAAINFPPQEGSLSKLTFELDYVGAFRGYGVNAPEGSTVVATDPTSSQPMAVATEVGGKGRIYSFGDEWIIFANQWEPKGQASNQQQDQYNVCYLMPTADSEGEFHSVATLYQTKQFWYNAINWVAPPNECNFTIDDQDVEIFVY